MVKRKRRVLVTGVGGASGLYTARILKKTGYYVLGTDTSDHAAGKALCDDFVVVPPAAERTKFVAVIKWLLGDYGIDVVLPNVDEELPIFAVERLSSIISPPWTIERCLDKYVTFETFYGRVPVPRTFIDLIDACGHPTASDPIGKIIVKPRWGRGSSGIHIFDDFQTFLGCSPFLFRGGGYIVQDYIEGEEYTVDVLLNRDHHPYCIAPRKRLRTHGGVSQVGETVHAYNVIKAVYDVCEILKFYGPVNMQFIDTGETVYLIEINPRLSGGIGITYANGANFPDLAVRHHFGELIVAPKLDYSVVYRYFVERKHEENDRDIHC